MPEIEVALHKAKPIAPAAVRQLYEQAGWWPERTLADAAANATGITPQIAQRHRSRIR